MSGRFWLDWATMALSLFNMILLIWLGLTVLLNANRRDWGVWLMGGGLLMGAVFFVSHSAILGQELSDNLDGLNFWWQAAWFPLTVSPIAWYVAVLWVSGFWAVPRSSLHLRHRLWLWIMVLWLVGLLALLLIGNLIPAYAQVLQFDLGRTLTLGNMPLLLLLFPLWTVTCILLSIDVLRRPAEVESSNTRTARRRALPWLLATAATLLAVALVVAYFVASVMTAAAAVDLLSIPIETIAVYDLVLSLLIALSSLLLGQAIVSYEIFTGRVLPRRSFVRHWRGAIVLAGGYAAVVGWTIAFDLRPIYSLLLATLLLTLFFALYSWRSFWDREQFAAQLRPFVQSQDISANPLHPASSADALFTVLCRDVLKTTDAQLVPLGRIASLVTAGLHYPPERSVSALPPLPELDAGMTPLDRARFAPYAWAISLWDERERIAVLLIGEMRDGGLYSQEVMETAQAAGERIVQMLASEQMVLRLVELQRRRTSEQRITDLRTRRTLHDEILPALHLAILQLNGANREQPLLQETVRTLADLHAQIANLLTHTQPAPAHTPDPCRLVTSLRGLVESEFAQSFDRIQWQGLMRQDPTAEDVAVPIAAPITVDPTVGEVILGAVREAIRNAATHARGDGIERPLFLRIGLFAEDGPAGELILTVADNGVGIEAGRTIATPSSAGSGNGLALHRTLLAIVGGYLTIGSSPGGGTTVKIAIPPPLRPL
jgi:hypothetical protein